MLTLPCTHALPHFIVLSGVSSVLTTMCDVDDDVARHFMVKFYEVLLHQVDECKQNVGASSQLSGASASQRRRKSRRRGLSDVAKNRERTTGSLHSVDVAAAVRTAALELFRSPEHSPFPHRWASHILLGLNVNAEGLMV